MPKPRGAFSVRRRPKKEKAFSRLPPDLSPFHNPKSRAAAENAAMTLIAFLKQEVHQGAVRGVNASLPVGDWLVRFTSLDNNPRAARLLSEGSPYSPATIELYRVYYGRYVSGDPFLEMDINSVDVPSTRAFMARVGMKKKKQTKKEKEAKIEKQIAGTRAYEITVNFVRMAFTEYWEDHQYWQNPFDRIDSPKRVRPRRRDILQEDEILRLFMPGVIPDTLERAVAVAMFWTGLRRAEIFGLRMEDLDWKTPKLKIKHAWKLFGSKKKRTLGDPKWHKYREAPFPEDLKVMIALLQKEYGKRDFVFSHKDGSIPHGKWISERLPVWMKNAGIDPAGRKIVPHSARHSLASALESNGVPLRYIRDMLGHSSMETTLGYLHTPEGTINRITKKIGELAKPKESKAQVIRFGNEGTTG